MIAPFFLFLVACLVGVGGSKWLAEARWPARAPALGIVAWLTVGVTTMLSILLAGAALAVPQIPSNRGLAELFHACSAALREHYATPGGGAVALIGGGLAMALLLRLAFALGHGIRADRRDRAHQTELLRLVGRRHDQGDVLVLEHDTPAAYCLPGKSRQVVITQGALGLLSEAELTQVLAHERAHIRSHHHLALLLSKALGTALFGQLGTGLLPRHVAELVEMHADDAIDHSRRPDLARAVILLAGGTLPAGAMGAGGAALARVRRLGGPPEPVALGHQFAVVTVAVAAVCLPVVIALAPGLVAILAHYCPLIG